MAGLLSNYLQYRVVRGSLRYVPDGTSSGVMETVAGGTAAPTYADRTFAMGIFLDPALSTISFENIWASGGTVGNTSRQHTLQLPPSGWLWTSTTTASPTTIDLRMTAFGKLYFAYGVASTTASASYGQLLLTIEFEGRGSVDGATPLGSTLANPSILKQQGPGISAVGLGNTDSPRAPSDTSDDREYKQNDSEFVSVSPQDGKKLSYSLQGSNEHTMPPKFLGGDPTSISLVSVDVSRLKSEHWAKLPDAVLAPQASRKGRRQLE